jgi:hypothetical protein
LRLLWLRGVDKSARRPAAPDNQPAPMFGAAGAPPSDSSPLWLPSLSCTLPWSSSASLSRPLTSMSSVSTPRSMAALTDECAGTGWSPAVVLAEKDDPDCCCCCCFRGGEACCRARVWATPHGLQRDSERCCKLVPRQTTTHQVSIRCAPVDTTEHDWRIV